MTRPRSVRAAPVPLVPARRAARSVARAADEALLRTPPGAAPWAEVLAALIRRHNGTHAAKPKNVSYKTMQERAGFLFAFFRELRTNEEKPFRFDPRHLGNRHIRFMVRRWLARGLAPATVQQYLSFLRTFSMWIGKPQLVMDAAGYIDDPQRHRRSYCAVEDKSWSAQGIDAERMFEAMSEIDRYAAAQLAVKSAFGLRRKEAVMLQPHRQVVTAAQAGIAGAPCECYLDLLKGTKGGRRRYLPIDSERKRLALARAREVARHPDGHLGDPARTLKQNLRRIDYVMAKLGITQQDLGITGHGLRHEYANDLYARETGVAPPLRGGPAVEPLLDRQARLKVARDLGHGRVQIAGAYLSGPLKKRARRSESEPDK